MGMKIHRGRRVFRARNMLPRILLWVVGAAAVIAVGFFGAKHFTERPIPQQPSESTDSVVSNDTASSDAPESATTTTTNKGDEKPTAPSLDTIRGFYLPFSALENSENLTAALTNAKEAGFTAVVFDLKDSDGNLYFQSQTARAQQVNSFAQNAFTLEETTDLFTAIRETGLSPVPRLVAFMDNAAAKALPAARVAHKSDKNWVWYDANPAKGGKAWLNPYADEAQLYIIELAKELKEAGAAAVMLDGVRFPAQTSSADFGSASTEKQRDEVLTAFVKKTQTLLGDNCPVLLCCTAESALGDNTLVYGNNPLTFSASVAAPMLMTGEMKDAVTVGSETLSNTPDNVKVTVKALTKQLVLRIKVMPKKDQPRLTPWLQAYDYTAQQIKDAVDGCIDGGANGYILYEPNGKYDFASFGD